MKTVAVTYEEGGEWLPFEKWKRPPTRKGTLVHSIRFDNGAVWDAYNGWRPNSRVRVKMGRADVI